MAWPTSLVKVVLLVRTMIMAVHRKTIKEQRDFDNTRKFQKFSRDPTLSQFI